MMRFLGLVVTALAVSLAGSHAAAASPFDCLAGEWKGVAVENLPEGSELLGGMTVVEQVARATTLRVAPNELSVERAPLESAGAGGETREARVPFSVERHAGDRTWVRLREPHDFGLGERRSLLFEVLSPTTLRVDLVEGQPFAFARVGDVPAPAAGCGAGEAERAALPSELEGEWEFRDLVGAGQRLHPRAAAVLETFKVEFDGDEWTVHLNGTRERGAYRLVRRDGPEITIASEMQAVGGAYGREAEVRLEIVDPDTLRIGLQSGKITLVMRRPGGGRDAPPPAAPTRSRRSVPGTGIVACEVGGRTVYKQAWQCR
jgi:hypothetical protein